MKRMVQVFLSGLVLFAFAGCAAKQGVFPIGKIEMGDKTYNWSSVKSQDKTGINSSTEVCISLDKKRGESKLEYANTGYQTGVGKALVEQIIPAGAELGKGALMGPAAALLMPSSEVKTTVTGAGGTQLQIQGQGQGQGQVIK